MTTYSHIHTLFSPSDLVLLFCYPAFTFRPRGSLLLLYFRPAIMGCSHVRKGQIKTINFSPAPWGIISASLHTRPRSRSCGGLSCLHTYLGAPILSCLGRLSRRGPAVSKACKIRLVRCTLLSEACQHICLGLGRAFPRAHSASSMGLFLRILVWSFPWSCQAFP